MTAQRITARDAQENWSVLDTYGWAVAQVDFGHGSGALAMDGAGNLCVADTGDNRVQKYTLSGP